jgi:hypothetical protein
MHVLAILGLFIALPVLAGAMETDVTPHYQRQLPPLSQTPQRPSDEQIKRWWLPARTWQECEMLDIIKVEPVVLESREKAFLCSVGFPDRPRLFLSGALLVRPELEEAREIPEIWRDFEVYDFDRDGISEIFTWGYSLGTGYIGGWKSILHFDGWVPVILHKQEFGDDLNSCGKEVIGRSCHSKEVYWSFTDLDGDGNIDLVETLIYKEGEEPEQLKWRSEVHAFLLKDKKFIAVTPDLPQPTDSGAEN